MPRSLVAMSAPLNGEPAAGDPSPDELGRLEGVQQVELDDHGGWVTVSGTSHREAADRLRGVLDRVGR